MLRVVGRLHKAAWEGHAGAVRELVGAGGDPKAQDGIGCTPLHAASANGRAGAVEALLAAGADPTIKDREGAMAIDDARAGQANEWERVVQLLEAAAGVAPDDSSGAPPLEGATASQGTVETAGDGTGAMTLADKVAAIKKELGLDAVLPAVDAIKEANVQLGLASEGSIPVQATKLMAALELG